VSTRSRLLDQSMTPNPSPVILRIFLTINAAGS
jgi:hypothetical protein